MIDKVKYLFFLLVLLLESCSGVALISKDATATTKTLYRNMYQVSKRGIMFGHQDANYYGHNWFEEVGRCDVNEVCGSYPAVIGCDFGEITNVAIVGAQRDSIADRLRTRIKDAYYRGCVNTVTWHLTNPVGGRSFYFAEDSIAAVPLILPNGSHHKEYCDLLRYIADFAKSLTDDDGEQIPVLFRPFHEYDGDWFWWGVPHHCSKEEFLSLWRFTVCYLRDTCGVQNFIYAFSPDCGPDTVAEYLEYYPGDDYVDILGMDNYWDLRADGGDQDLFVAKLKVLDSLAISHHKVIALTETGVEGLPDAHWWTKTLLPLICESGASLSYVMMWRNAYQSKKHYYAPFVGEPSCADFVNFRKSGKMLFLNDIPNMYQ